MNFLSIKIKVRITNTKHFTKNESMVAITYLTSEAIIPLCLAFVYLTTQESNVSKTYSCTYTVLSGQKGMSRLQKQHQAELIMA